MANDKLKLPTGVTPDSPALSETIQAEILKTKRTSIDAGAKVEVAKLEVAKEGLIAVRSLFEVLKSHNDLQATRAEWEGRIATAETAVRKAEVDLETAREKNLPRMQELQQSKAAQDRVLQLFDNVMGELTSADLSSEGRAATIETLLEISDKLVQLRK
jgi:hypothetical protein